GAGRRIRLDLLRPAHGAEEAAGCGGEGGHGSDERAGRLPRPAHQRQGEREDGGFARAFQPHPATGRRRHRRDPRRTRGEPGSGPGGHAFGRRRAHQRPPAERAGRTRRPAPRAARGIEDGAGLRGDGSFRGTLRGPRIGRRAHCPDHAPRRVGLEARGRAVRRGPDPL
ncbi:MAG: hypothetical protein AVDCRST_MAG89-4708, partial [uncultured Gemmatimonadetes bacterium]